MNIPNIQPVNLSLEQFQKAVFESCHRDQQAAHPNFSQSFFFLGFHHAVGLMLIEAIYYATKHRVCNSDQTLIKSLTKSFDEKIFKTLENPNLFINPKQFVDLVLDESKFIRPV